MASSAPVEFLDDVGALFEEAQQRLAAAAASNAIPSANAAEEVSRELAAALRARAVEEDRALYFGGARKSAGAGDEEEADAEYRERAQDRLRLLGDLAKFLNPPRPHAAAPAPTCAGTDDAAAASASAVAPAGAPEMERAPAAAAGVGAGSAKAGAGAGAGAAREGRYCNDYSRFEAAIADTDSEEELENRRQVLSEEEAERARARLEGVEESLQSALARAERSGDSAAAMEANTRLKELRERTRELRQLGRAELAWDDRSCSEGGEASPAPLPVHLAPLNDGANSAACALELDGMD
eukprot:TRINITY_DN1018_c1_g1_i1.p1 TRINITY_DN1018_c1_g1~~TRINITY_DN1018_c1_g1_i1.p1  ORF type:complete len:297 (-),score=92.09 TRINITY_DN1018_c1_g1_i1:26-916(-)